jgi:catechol 2,3-dioxygenase-like lactoylglutathione lyase family enzyme
MAKLSAMIGFLVTTKPEAARKFYTEVLGFRLLSDDLFALAFDAHGAMLRVGKAEKFTPAPNTVLGWEVEDIFSTVTELKERGVTFEQYASMKADEQGIFAFPNGDKVAWFKDPEGNVLSISQHVIGINTVGQKMRSSTAT